MQPRKAAFVLLAVAATVGGLSGRRPSTPGAPRAVRVASPDAGDVQILTSTIDVPVRTARTVVATPPMRGYDARPGQHFVFATRAEWQTRLRAPKASTSGAEADQLPPRVSVSLVGELAISVLDRDDEGYVLGAHLERVELAAAAGSARRGLDSVSLTMPFFFRLSTEGKILGYVFPPDADAQARRILTSLVALGQQFPTVGDTGGTVSGLWDASGEFSAELRWRPPKLVRATTDAVLARRVVAYSRLADGAASAGVLRVDGSEAEATFGDGWVAAVEAREARSTVMGRAFKAVASTRLTLERIRSDAIIVDAGMLPAAAAEWQLVVPDDAAEIAAAVEAADEPSLPALEEVLASLAELAASDRLDAREAFDAWTALSKLVLRDPDAGLAGLDAAIREGALEGASAGFAVSALGLAASEGSAPAAALLGELIADVEVGEDVRLAALMSSHHTNDANPGLADAATNILQGSMPGSDDRLPNAALLLLGSLAGKAIDADQYAGIRSSLDAARQWAFENGQAAAYFGALENSGRPELIVEALDYVQHPDEAVRGQALQALRAAGDDPRVLDALAKAAGGSDAVSVRLAALESLGMLPPSPVTVLPVVAAAGPENPEAVRAGAILALAEHARAGSGLATEALERAARDASPEIRQLATGILADTAASDPVS